VQEKFIANENPLQINPQKAKYSKGQYFAFLGFDNIKDKDKDKDK